MADGKGIHLEKRNLAQRTRAVRQEELRKKLEAGGHLNQVLLIAKQLRDLKEVKLDSLEVDRLKSAAALHMKLVNKYLPDVREMDVNVSGQVSHEHTAESLSDTARWIEGFIVRDDEAEPAQKSLPN